MRYFTPEFYNDFRCIASACPDSCCKEWEVDIDPHTASFYHSLTGPLGEHLRRVLRTDENGSTCMIIQAGRCPMWRQDGLCQIQAELGHEALSQICREYPRIRHDYGNFIEMGLELSCPEAARLILTSNYDFHCSHDEQKQEPLYESSLMDILLRSRREAVAFLETSSLPLSQRLAVLLLYAYDVQAEIDGGNVAQLTEQENLADAFQYTAIADIHAFLDFFLSIEILTPQWENMLHLPHAEPIWDPLLMPFARYLIYRYWLQAVSDYDLVCRAKFIVIACLLVATLGGNTISTAQLFSKEIENDPDNIEAILDGAYTCPAFTDVQLLSLLLNS